MTELVKGRTVNNVVYGKTVSTITFSDGAMISFAIVDDELSVMGCKPGGPVEQLYAKDWLEPSKGNA